MEFEQLVRDPLGREREVGLAEGLAAAALIEQSLECDRGDLERTLGGQLGIDVADEGLELDAQLLEAGPVTEALVLDRQVEGTQAERA